jgi:hypothetical protein
MIVLASSSSERSSRFLVEEKHGLSGFTVNTRDGIDVLEAIELNNVSLVLEGSPASGQ